MMNILNLIIFLYRKTNVYYTTIWIIQDENTKLALFYTECIPQGDKSVIAACSFLNFLFLRMFGYRVLTHVSEQVNCFNSVFNVNVLR
jgi:hypothetical protein